MADNLTATSRVFYERTKGKFVISFVLGAVSLMILGFCTSAGGIAQSFKYQLDIFKAEGLSETSNSANSVKAIAAGFGFAAFLYIVSFLLLVIAAVYASPMICGSANEKKMMSSPQEVETGFAVSDSSGVAPQRGLASQA